MPGARVRLAGSGFDHGSTASIGSGLLGLVAYGDHQVRAQLDDGAMRLLLPATVIISTERLGSRSFLRLSLIPVVTS